MSTKRTRIVEVFGSLLNSERRKKTFEKGIVKEIGKVKRERWKLSFDRKSVKNWKGEAVLNFVSTDNQEDVYYTTVFEVDEIAYAEVMKSEMGSKNVEKWEKSESLDYNSYRPKSLDSKFGKTEVFIIPKEEQDPTPAHWEDKYVNMVWIGIKESYKKCPQQMEVNLKALKRAVEESKLLHIDSSQNLI